VGDGVAVGAIMGVFVGVGACVGDGEGVGSSSPKSEHDDKVRIRATITMIFFSMIVSRKKES
jgi:hypothetical protein